MTTLREKRHRQCLDSIGRLTEQRELAFRRLAIVQNRLTDERRRLTRLQKELPKKVHPANIESAMLYGKAQTMGIVHDVAAVQRDAPPIEDMPPPKQQAVDSGDVELSIPDFLWRGPLAKDAAARAEIEAEQAARKAVKTKARIAKMKATQSGETRRMPLTGRAALKRIREG